MLYKNKGQETKITTQANLKVSQEGRITEHFTRAIDQLGNPAIEIRLGGIYALERIANESEKNYWPIMEIFTAYVRKNSCVDSRLKEKSKAIKDISMDIQTNESTKKDFSKTRKIPFDIQAILTVIGRRRNSLNHRKSNCLNLEMTCLQGADLTDTYFEGANFINANLEGAFLIDSHLEGANLSNAHLEGADLMHVHLERVDLKNAHLEGTDLKNAHLEGADLKNAHLEMTNLEWAKLEGTNLKNANIEKSNLSGANLEGADLKNVNLKNSYLVGTNLKGADLKNVNFEGANLMWTNFKGVNLEGARLEEANLEGAVNLTIEQLSRVQTLYNAKLDTELLRPLKEEYPALFEEP